MFYLSAHVITVGKVLAVGESGRGDRRLVVNKRREPRVAGQGRGQHLLDLGADVHSLVNSDQRQRSSVTSVEAVTSIAWRSSEPIEIGGGTEGTNQPNKL